MFASTSRTMFMMAGAACASIAAAATPSLSESSEPRKKIVVVGGGTAGLTVAAQLMKKTQGSLDVILIEPRTVHYYQPMWTMIGGHLGFTSTDSARPMKDLVPKNIQWLQSSVDKFLPEKDTVILKSGESLTYDSLVVAAGIKNDLDRIKGLREALEDPSSPVGSIYDAKFAEKTERMLSKIKKGDVLFTQPPNPIKCGGAPQKVMWLWESVFRQTNIRQDVNVSFFTSLGVMFPVEKYGNALKKMSEEKNVETNFKHSLVQVDGVKQIATFTNDDTGKQISRYFDFLHVTPHMSPPDFIQKSPLADSTGYVEVNINTLQHKRYANVFSLGDCAALPTSKTAAAVSSQAPVLVSNVLKALKGQPLTASYDGYTSCPILVGDNKLILAEFLYGGKVDETFGRLVDQAIPSRIMFHVKRDLFPYIYWNHFIKGTWYGRHLFMEPK